MSELFNVYCDESCHLENDGGSLMVLGAVWCPADKAREIAERVRDIKVKHGLPASFEVKWVKVSPGGTALYQDLLDYFFDDDDLRFRALVADKANLRHDDFGQTHDEWYFKMYFDLLKVILNPEQRYHIYLDVKDTRSASKVRKLHEVLANNVYDFDRSIVERVQIVRSHEVEQLQLADLLIGIVGYANRELETSPAKIDLVERMRQRSHYTLRRSTLLREQKTNLFHWRPRPVEQ